MFARLVIPAILLFGVPISTACGTTPRASHPTTPVYEFSGSCAWARPLGSQSRYRKQLRTLGSAGDAIQVRSTARIDSRDASNRIGQLPVGVIVAGNGPLHFASADGQRTRVAYAVAVRDVNGRSCRGYVDAARVRVVDSASATTDRGKR